MSRLVRHTAVIIGFGFRAAPGWMWATLALTVVNGISAGLYPYGFKLFTDASLARDAVQLAIAVAVTGGLIATNWTAANFDANVGFGLVDRVNLFVSARIARLVNDALRIEHFERPDYLRELDLVEQNLGMLTSGPRQALTTMQSLLRAGTVVALLGSVHPVLLLLPILGLAPTLAEASSVRIRQRAEERMAEAKRLADQLFALATTPGPAKEARTFGFGGELLLRHTAIAADVTRRTTRAAVTGAAVAGAGWILFIAGFLAAVGVMLSAAVRGEVSPGEVVMAVVLAQQIRVVLANVATATGQLLTTARTVQRLLWLEGVVRTASDGHLDAPTTMRDGIQVHGVSFRYPNSDSDVLTDLNLAFPAGSTVALVGENGAGKTTLIKLLCGMYEPTSGTVTVDGVPINDIRLSSWRSRLSATFQDFVPFELIARETVGIGDLPRIHDERAVEAALERGAAEDVVASLERGLDTQLGRSFPGGRELSGGQWQKLALGRGVMREEPLLLILDEPTASLDAATEHQLFDRYAHAAKRTAARTGGITILVSHRFSTVRNADLIVVIDNGTVVESGSHEDLMAINGLYAELFSLQARAYL